MAVNNLSWRKADAPSSRLLWRPPVTTLISI